MTFLSVLAWLFALPPLLSLAIFTLEVLAGLKPLPSLTGDTALPRVAILIPAHNEEAAIL